jgi:uncharacterized membrane protein
VNAPRGARASRLATLSGLGLLLGSLAATAVAAEGRHAGTALALALALPLLLPLPGLLRAHRRTYAWAALCLLPGLVYALTELVANPGVRAQASLAVLATLWVFVALVAYLRCTRGRRGGQPGSAA